MHFVLELVQGFRCCNYSESDGKVSTAAYLQLPANGNAHALHLRQSRTISHATVSAAVRLSQPQQELVRAPPSRCSSEWLAGWLTVWLGWVIAEV